MSPDLHILVLGGGAAGFFAAITCAEANPQARVTILDKSRALLSKVRISGGGRCNVTNACFDSALLVQYYPRGSAALRGPFTRFQPRDTIEWFEQRGVQLKIESDGRVFPVTDRSETIVECLLNSAQRAGVTIRTQVSIASIEREERSGFVVRTTTGEVLNADRILLATGSNPQGYAWAAALGHTIEPSVPSLFTFTIDDARLQGLAGIAVPHAQVEIAGTSLAQSGPLLITHWGLSGPAILKLSAWGARLLHDRSYRAQLIIDWLPDRREDDVRQQLQAIRSDQPKKYVGSSSPFGLPMRLWLSLIGAIGLDADRRWTEVSKRHLAELIDQLKRGVYDVRGKGEFKEEFVTCGGVALDEIDFKTMESRVCPGLHFAGEILDIDGLTGGFNFQAAWTTGWMAGRAMAGKVIPAVVAKRG
ncbi:MAG TPA: NAD(P)/FAD-dependent oxidoreductase [Anaerolineae bacterium]|nr:NAD(P)/FAD-dependent oxidoreductase [Anaerolineae bacterium]